jgi:hypothetical protein
MKFQSKYEFVDICKTLLFKYFDQVSDLCITNKILIGFIFSIGLKQISIYVFCFNYNYENEKAIFHLLLVLFCSSIVAQNNSFNLLIGTYTKGCDSKGMYVYDFDSDTGDFNLKMFQNTINPSYLTVSNDNNFLFCK